MMLTVKYPNLKCLFSWASWFEAIIISITHCHFNQLIAGSLEAAYSLNWGAQEIWGKGGGETLALL